MEYASRFAFAATAHRRRFPLPISALFLPAIAAFLFSGCGKQEPAHPPQSEGPVTATVVTVEPRDVPVAFEYIAQVQSSRQVNIQARVSGFLEKRVYNEGEIVQEGKTLFLMDQKPFEAQLAQAQAALARQEAAYAVARQNLARVKPLAEADALSQKDLDDARGQYESSAAAVEQAKAAVEQAKLNLSYTVITSPVTGITGSAEQADGTYLGPANSQLTTVTVISPVYINFSVSENDWLRYRRRIAKGLLIPPADHAYVAEILLADGSLYPHTGTVTFADPSFNAQTGTFLIRATVDNPDNLLRPNQYVRIRLKGAVMPGAILVPQRAVQQSSKGHFLWVLDKEDKAEERPVVVGEWREDQWIITEGLNPGDRVVVDGILGLRPGTPVRTGHRVEKKDEPGSPESVAAPAQDGR